MMVQDIINAIGIAIIVTLFAALSIMNGQHHRAATEWEKEKVILVREKEIIENRAVDNGWAYWEVGRTNTLKWHDKNAIMNDIIKTFPERPLVPFFMPPDLKLPEDKDL